MSGVLEQKPKAKSKLIWLGIIQAGLGTLIEFGVITINALGLTGGVIPITTGIATILPRLVTSQPVTRLAAGVDELQAEQERKEFDDRMIKDAAPLLQRGVSPSHDGAVRAKWDFDVNEWLKKLETREKDRVSP